MPEPPRYNVLVLYFAAGWPLRTTIEDHLYALDRYSGQRVFYWNTAAGTLPEYYRRVPFDLVVFHTTLLGRWYRESFWQLVRPLGYVKQFGATLAAMPQDEFLSAEQLVEFINDYGIDHVFSVAPPSEWSKIYDGVDRTQTQIHEVLTGYLDPRTIETVERMAARAADRKIDVGYRAYRAAPWLGRFGTLKAGIADAFLEAAARHDLAVDISTDEADTFKGLDWYRFLLHCKYTVGVEGGSSLLDRSGLVKERTEQYVAEHPGAGFEEVEEACFAGLDGTLELFALSPRHLEACLTRTCQVLVEGSYNGVLKPHQHYIPLRADLSNVDEVCRLVREDTLRDEMIQRAYDDVVASDAYTTRQFAGLILEKTLAGSEPRGQSAELDGLHRRAEREDRRSWRRVRRLKLVRRMIPPWLRKSRRTMGLLRRVYEKIS